ncbi:DNA damage-regulated autophagy modulator protein 2-like [Xenopus laevis]|uniref:DNA damage-regulated autophagy modulator protein 2-like n=1 Tax=Xenopus laevis TaxID=8355 RepID=A0A8J1KYU8_XENLA|nr:DNA damage-regulated autophagy modulator protein 2-like [Xenopus laevis]
MAVSRITGTISSILDVAVKLLNYKFIKLYRPKVTGVYNRLILCLGLLSCAGFLLAGYVRGKDSETGHLTGAFVGFGTGCVYNIVQCILYAILQPSGKSRRMVYYRLFACVITVIPMIALTTSLTTCSILTSCNPHYLRTALATLEWAGMFGLLLYMPTYSMEFQNLTLKWPKSLKGDWICKREGSTDVESPEEPTTVTCRHMITLLPSDQLLGSVIPINIQGAYRDWMFK